MTVGLRFPDGFVWGAATAAYQIEGAARDDGRGPSIWDTFTRTPGKVYAGHTGDIACDHYHRYPDDITLMAQLGLHAYRFSIAWPRIQPDGTGPINPHGLDFYDRLVDTLHTAGIQPIITLYHWDLPQNLQDHGGWTTRDTAHRFADYATAVHHRLGDRVHTWTTLNEPWCAAFLGYAAGIHAPGHQNPTAAFHATHHLLLAHGLATTALRTAGTPTLGITLNPAAIRPANPHHDPDTHAAHLIDGLHNRIFLDPLLTGGYPPDVLTHITRYTNLDHIHDGDEKTIATPIDLLGINYYSPTYLTADPQAAETPAYPGSHGIRFLPPTGPVTDMGWAIEPTAFTELLQRIHHDYPGTPIMITENGAAFEHHGPDHDRISYLDSHLRALHQAIHHGVDIRGYLVWSLLDNFEWAEGYRKRFGIIHVDYTTQQRTLKHSAHWYRNVIANNGLDSP